MSVRQRLVLSLLLLIPLGIGTKFYVGPGADWVQGHAGGVLYVVFWIVTVITIVPSFSPWKTAVGVLLATCLLEFLQRWEPLVLEEIRQSFIGHALIGSTFEWWDLPHYGLGALLGAVLVRQIVDTESEH